jgi:S1-C subfamily serine protease
VKISKTLFTKERAFLKKNETLLIRIFGAGLVLSLAGLIYLAANTSRMLTPTETAEYAATSVRITNMAETSGGTGVVIQSGPAESTVLTNKHVCKVIEAGGIVGKNGNRFLVKQYKTYKYHDLCMVQVTKNLGINTRLAKAPPATYSEALISGHPALLPHVLSKGNFSDDMVITVMTGTKKCTDADSNNPYCAVFGVMPIVVTYNSTLVTGLIMPGSSGSAVFNKNGEISAMIFAGAQGLSYGFVVPYEYLVDFIARELNNSKGWTLPDASKVTISAEEQTRGNVVVGINNKWILSQEQIGKLMNAKSSIQK